MDKPLLKVLFPNLFWMVKLLFTDKSGCFFHKEYAWITKLIKIFDDASKLI